jgi:hypothetical protein
MHALAVRTQNWVRNLSLARKIIVVIMGVSSTALLLACLALVAYDSTTARTRLTRDIGMLADVVGATEHRGGLVQRREGGDRKPERGRGEPERADGAILRNGAVFARFDRKRDTQSQSILTRIDPALGAHAAAGLHLRRRLAARRAGRSCSTAS